MKKLTNKSVAKALGFKQGPKDMGARWWRGNADTLDHAPAFTTSLDAIVAEIEARGLPYTLDHNGMKYWGACVGEQKLPDKASASAPLALCAALIAYLEAQP